MRANLSWRPKTLVGNPGNSTAPYLHIRVSTGESSTGSYPLLLHGVQLQSQSLNPKGPTYAVDGQEILHESLAFPTK